MKVQDTVVRKLDPVGPFNPKFDI